MKVKNEIKKKHLNIKIILKYVSLILKIKNMKICEKCE